MSKGQIAVVAIAGAGLMGLIGYELYALLSKNPETRTISRYVWDASYRYPLLPFAVGLVIGALVGHFWWQAKQP